MTHTTLTATRCITQSLSMSDVFLQIIYHPGICLPPRPKFVPRPRSLSENVKALLIVHTSMLAESEIISFVIKTHAT